MRVPKRSPDPDPSLSLSLTLSQRVDLIRNLNLNQRNLNQMILRIHLDQLVNLKIMSK